MLASDILRLRLANQQLARPELRDPARLVARLGAVQAQDYPGAQWALGQRLLGATHDSIERAFAEGSILRTHVMRPTWHFVAPADIRWLLALTAPRVKAAVAHYDRTLGLDDVLVARSNEAIGRALEGGNYLTRAELDAALRQAGIAARNGQALAHLVMRAELEAVVCSGPRRGKQFTYARLDERVPPTRPRDPDEALAELTARYFTSHGPATVRDFAWWSGLTVAAARRGLALNGPASPTTTSTGSPTGSRRPRRRRATRPLTCCRTTTSTPSPTRTATSTTTRARAGRPNGATRRRSPTRSSCAAGWSGCGGGRRARLPLPSRRAGSRSRPSHSARGWPRRRSATARSWVCRSS